MPKILVVDDNSNNRSFLVTLLGYGGHELIEAADGAEALNEVASKRPDLVITDILMPTMDGYEFVRRLRSSPEIAHTPVIFCTAHFHERDAKDLARECGVSHVLTKPCNPETVIQAVDECFDKKSGMLASHDVDPGFDREHLRLLTHKLLDQTSELTTANARLQALLDITLQLSSECNPARLLDRFCTAARDLITARFSLVFIPAEGEFNAGHLYLAGVERERLDIGFRPDHTLFTSVMENRQPMRLRNPTGDPAVLALPPAFHSFESLLIAPIVSPTRAYGWLGLFHRLGAAEFSEEDERLAAILAALVGRVYENGRLYADERSHAAELKREIAERRKAQEESAQLADIVQSSDDGIIGMKLDGRIVTWNRGAEVIFGYSAEEVRGNSLSLLLGPQRADELGDALGALQERRSVARYETAGIKRGGGPVELSVTLSPILKADGSLSGASAIVRDVTSQKRLRQQLFVAQKMEAIGRLSAGIAHDFNNLLTVIAGYSEMFLSRRIEQDPEYNDILQVSRAAERAAALTRQLLAFSRRQIIQVRVVDLNAVVADMDRMLRRVIGEDIDLVTELDPALGSTKTDIGHVEQIIMNLAVNARDAMPEGGKLTIHTANLDLEDALVVRNSAVPRGSYVILSITDTGIGMDAETQDRIFEPFFTTKEPGRGTGLGLSTVYGIVEQSGGIIGVYSERGRGTTFRIFLPRVREAISSLQPAPAPAPVRRGFETILVVEDEDAVRALVSTILKREGYGFLEAKNGGEALLLCEKHPEKINLMISDITMPGMSGVELAQRFSELRPEMRVLLMSGYAEKAIIHQRVLPPDVPFLEKPFSPQGLARKVREVLDRAG